MVLCGLWVHCGCGPERVASDGCGSSLEESCRSMLLHRLEVSATPVVEAAPAVGVELWEVPVVLVAGSAPAGVVVHGRREEGCREDVT